MTAKPKTRNWDDVQTAIATAAIVTTLGMWNIFATPAKAEEVEVVPTETSKPAQPAVPLTAPPVGYPVDTMPYVKIMFAEAAPQITADLQQPQQEKKKKKKKNKNSGGGGGTTTVTNTQSS